MFQHLPYHWRRFSSRLHRLRLALHARGWRGVLARVSTRDTLPTQPAPPLAAKASVDAALPRRRVLLIDVATPQPDRDSGSLRAFNLMRVLLSEGYAVDFMADEHFIDGTATDRLQIIGVTVHLRATGESWPTWLARHLDRYDFTIISRYHLAEFLTPLIRRLAPATRVVLDTVDLHHLRESREALLHSDRQLHKLATITRRRELAAAAAADVVWVVSPVEAEILRAELPTSQIEILPNLHEPEPIATPFEQRSGVLFVGGAAHPPNLDAVRWLLAEIVPAMNSQLSDCPVHIVGDGMREALADRMSATPANVRIHGHVPDLSTLLGQCRAGIAPLRFGAGVKGKINLCMAAGLPVVATSCASEGMYLEDNRNILVADRADAFAAAVVRLHKESLLWDRLARAGLNNIRDHFSFDAARSTVASSFRRDRV